MKGRVAKFRGGERHCAEGLFAERAEGLGQPSSRARARLSDACQQRRNSKDDGRIWSVAFSGSIVSNSGLRAKTVTGVCLGPSPNTYSSTSCSLRTSSYQLSGASLPSSQFGIRSYHPLRAPIIYDLGLPQRCASHGVLVAAVVEKQQAHVTSIHLIRSR